MANTVTQLKRIIGRKYSEPGVRAEFESFLNYTAVQMDDDEIGIRVSVAAGCGGRPCLLLLLLLLLLRLRLRLRLRRPRANAPPPFPTHGNFLAGHVQRRGRRLYARATAGDALHQAARDHRAEEPRLCGGCGGERAGLLH
jgi:hypothetical protein